MPKPDKWIHRWTVNSQSYGEDGPYTVALARDGSWGCSCKGWIFQKVRPREDCKHIVDVKRGIDNPPLPWPGAWAMLEQLPQPPDWEPSADLFLRALVERAEQRYIESGYSGHFIHYNDLDEVCGSDWKILDHLNGYLERASCFGFALELPAERKLFLIHRHNLLDAWAEKGRSWYPTAYGGEFFNVWRALTHWEFCPRCRQWQQGKEHNCRPEPWMAYLNREE